MSLISKAVFQELQEGSLKDILRLFKNAGLFDVGFTGLAYITAKYVNKINTSESQNFNSDFLKLGIIFGGVSSIIISNKGTFLKNALDNRATDYSLQMYILKQAVDFTAVKVSKKALRIDEVNINTNKLQKSISEWLTKEFKLPSYRTKLKNVKVTTNYIKYFLLGFIAGFVGFFIALYFIIKKRRGFYTLGDYLSDIKQYLLKYIAADVIATLIISYFILRSTKRKISMRLPDLDRRFLRKIDQDSDDKEPTYKIISDLSEPERILFEKILSVRDTLRKVLDSQGVTSKFDIRGVPSSEDNLYITYDKNSKKYNIVFKIRVDHSIWQFLTHDEIIAVILHELGHYIGKHLTFDKFLFAITVASFDLTSVTYISNITKAYFKALQKYIIYSIYRYEEMQADKFVAEVGYGKALANALSKMSTMYGSDPSEEYETIHGSTEFRIQSIEDLLKFN